MGVGANGAPDVVMGHGDSVDGLERTDLVADRHHEPDAGGARPGDHLGLILGELRRMQIDVRIDQHASGPRGGGKVGHRRPEGVGPVQIERLGPAGRT